MRRNSPPSGLSRGPAGLCPTASEHRLNLRRGFTVLESMIALGLLGAALTIFLPLLSSARQARLSVERQRVAQTEVANILEQISQIEWKDLTPESARKVQLSEAAGHELPDPRLNIDVATESGNLPAKRITVELQWQPSGGRKSPPCRLVTWAYPDREPQP